LDLNLQLVLNEGAAVLGCSDDAVLAVRMSELLIADCQPAQKKRRLSSPKSTTFAIEQDKNTEEEISEVRTRLNNQLAHSNELNKYFRLLKQQHDDLVGNVANRTTSMVP
jgi:hypothetical protein